MKVKKSVALMLAAALGVVTAILPANADDHKDELIQLIRQQDGKLEALAVEKLFTINMSPEWWQYFLKEDTRAYHTLRNIADGIMIYGQNMGGDDIRALDQTRDASSPLVTEALNKLATKAHCTIDFTQPVTEQYRKQVKENLDLMGAPIGEKYYCNPRGHKLDVTISLDTKAKALGCTVSKDGNTYHFMIPAYMSISTSPIEEAFKKGS